MFAAPLSALNAASWQMAAAAGNIANASTQGYSAQRVDLAESTGGGVATAGVTFTGDPDLVGDFATLLQAGAAFRLNLKVLRAQSTALGSVLDLLA
ncbi:MAG: hypothetical protein IT452_06435 [Planctomycetia bacterium]|nr:hypothetical protein [Planctomycetia bacterium]